MKKDVPQKLAFYEVGEGRCGQDFQREFEKAQKVAMETNLPVKIKLEMVVKPPNATDNEYMEVQYKHSIKIPEIISRMHSTVHIDGVIIRDAQKELPQMELDLIQDVDGNGNELNFKQKNAN